MTRLSILLATLLLPAVFFQNTRASIEGTVVQDSTGKPLANASIELTVVEGARVVSRKATSGRDGRFSFRDLAPGEGYQLVVTGTGLLPAAYGQERSYGPWKPIALAPGEQLSDLRIAVHAISQISGKVLDSVGKVQVGASVFALQPTYVNGRRELQRAANTVTNLRGEYRFTSLPAGCYYIRVSPQNDGVADSLFTNPALRDRSASTIRATSITEAEGYATVYYPGVHLESAKAIALEDSQGVDGLDITVTRSRTSRVRGTVTNNTTGRRVAAARVSLLPAGSSPDSNWGRFHESKDGTFDLRGVLPGMYFLNAVTMTGGRQLAGRVVVDILGGDTRTFDVRIAPGTDISGRILVDDPNVTAPDLSKVSLSLVSNSLQPVDGTLARTRSNLPSSTAAVTADGTFTIPGVMPWDYRVNVSGIPGAYVKSVRYGDLDALASELRVEGSTEQSMEIVLAVDGGRLDGRLLQGNIARVVLVPEARDRRDLYAAVFSSNTGRFQLTDIPPGRYKIFAWQNPDDGAWTDPDFLERYESRGTPVEIRSESSEYAEIEVIPTP